MGSGLPGAGPGPRSQAGTPGPCAKASKKGKGRILGRGLLGHGPEPGGRARCLVAAAKRPPSRRTEPRARARRHSYDSLRGLQRVWVASGGQCGKIPQGVHALLPRLLETNREPPAPARHGNPAATPAGDERRARPPLQSCRQKRAESHERNRPSTATSPRREPPTICGASQQPRPVR